MGSMFGVYVFIIIIIDIATIVIAIPSAVKIWRDTDREIAKKKTRKLIYETQEIIKRMNERHPL